MESLALRRNVHFGEKNPLLRNFHVSPVKSTFRLPSLADLRFPEEGRWYMFCVEMELKSEILSEQQ